MSLAKTCLTVVESVGMPVAVTLATGLFDAATPWLPWLSHSTSPFSHHPRAVVLWLGALYYATCTLYTLLGRTFGERPGTGAPLLTLTKWHVLVTSINAVITGGLILYLLEFTQTVTHPADVPLPLRVAGASGSSLFPHVLALVTVTLFCTLMDEITFFVVHRSMHAFPALYRMHKWHHEAKTTHPFAAAYAHPIDHALLVLCVLTGPYVLALAFAPNSAVRLWLPSGVTPQPYICAFLSIAFVTFVQGHCGYWFPHLPRPWSLLLRSTLLHEYHHARTVYNYSNFGILDQWNGTLWDPDNPPTPTDDASGKGKGRHRQCGPRWRVLNGAAVAFTIVALCCTWWDIMWTAVAAWTG